MAGNLSYSMIRLPYYGDLLMRSTVRRISPTQQHSAPARKFFPHRDAVSSCLSLISSLMSFYLLKRMAYCFGVVPTSFLNTPIKWLSPSGVTASQVCATLFPSRRSAAACITRREVTYSFTV